MQEAKDLQRPPVVQVPLSCFEAGDILENPAKFWHLAGCNFQIYAEQGSRTFDGTLYAPPRRRLHLHFFRCRPCKTFELENRASVVPWTRKEEDRLKIQSLKDSKILNMKSQDQPSKSRSFQLLKSPSNHSGKIRKSKSMTPELPKSKSRKISTDQVPLQSSRLSEKFQTSLQSALESSGSKRKILTDAPVNVKRFKDSEGKSVQDREEADLDDLSKESSVKKNEAQVGVEYSLRSDDRPVILIPAAHTWSKKKELKVVEPEVNVMEPEVKRSADNVQEIVNNDTSMESNLDAISTPTCINESRFFLSTFETSEGEKSEVLEVTLNEVNGINLVEQPTFVRSSVSSEEGQASGDLEADQVDEKIDQVDDETEELDVETESNDVATEEEEDHGIENDQDSTCKVVDAEDDGIENPQDANLECDLESSTALQADRSLEESNTDAPDAKKDQADFEPGAEVDVKSTEEFDPESDTCSLSFSEESIFAQSISSLTPSTNFDDSVADSNTSEGIVTETVAKKINFDTEESNMDDTAATGITLLNQDQEMEQDDENSAGDPNGTSDVDMTSQAMTPGGQIIHDVGTNETSLDESILAGPSNRVENLSASSFMMPQDSERIHQYQRVTKIERVVPASDGKEAVLTHESVRNYTLHLSSGDDAPNLSCPQGNMLDSLFHDEGDEELERIMTAWNESQLGMPQCNAGQHRWNLTEDDGELYTILALVLVFFILFIARHLIEAVRSVPPF